MTMKISHIVAMAENRVIGRAGGMPWHIPEDFKFFKATTMGHAMIMGRKTWESIGRALPGRLSIVITRNPKFGVPEGVLVRATLDEAIEYCEQHQNEWGSECFIVGGGELYRQSLSLTDRVYLTQIHQSIEGDTTYPELPKSAFKQISVEPHRDAATPFSFTVWDRIQK